MIEPPATSRSSPAPTVQRRSKPVNGSVLADAFAGFAPLVAGALLAVAGATDLAGVVGSASFVDFDGEVPLPGDGVVVAGVVVAGVVVAGVVVAGVVVVGVVGVGGGVV